MRKTIDSFQSQNNTVCTGSDSSSLTKRVIVFFWLISIILGALHAWDARHAMNADGISYMDIADAYMRGDWDSAINAYWSPLYSWLLGIAMIILKPTPYYEFSVVHLVNFFIYLCTMGCFHFLLMQLIHFKRFQRDRTPGDSSITFPDWAWIALGYSMFIYSSLQMITIESVTPDMCVAAFVYLAGGILLRIHIGSNGYLTFALLGLVLGFGYLAKSVMFPLAFVFLSVGAFSMGNMRRSSPRFLIAFIIFLVIASPFIIAISTAKGRFTFGDSGKYNYWLGVSSNNIGRHWTGALPGEGTPKHPVRKIFFKPALYEFGTPISATYPVWYDPSYWYDGIETPFDLKKQFSAILISIESYFDTLYPSHSVLVFSSIILYLMGRRRWMIMKDIASHWSILIPAAAALGLYSLVATAPRYTAPFLMLLWLVIFSGIRLPATGDSKRLLSYTSIVITCIMIIISIQHSPVYSTLMLGSSRPHLQWQVANTLNKMGLVRADRVASIGTSHSHFWARLAKVRIVAEMPRTDENYFWEANSTVKANIIETFRKTGAKAIVTKYVPGNIAPVGWERVAQSDYYVYMLNK